MISSSYFVWKILLFVDRSLEQTLAMLSGAFPKHVLYPCGAMELWCATKHWQVEVLQKALAAWLAQPPPDAGVAVDFFDKTSVSTEQFDPGSSRTRTKKNHDTVMSNVFPLFFSYHGTFCVWSKGQGRMRCCLCTRIGMRETWKASWAPTPGSRDEGYDSKSPSVFHLKRNQS